VGAASPVPSPSPGAGVTEEQVINALKAKFGNLEVKRFDTIGPTFSQELIDNARNAVIIASVGILLFVAFAFRSFKAGVCAIVALLHDVFLVIGVFAILGKLLNVEVDSLFVTALLTVIGFSVHDTIVVFDRIRENKKRLLGEPIGTIINHSLIQTLARSINTSLTVVFTLLALYLFGGGTIHNFTLALLIGVISGSYSSIFNASQLLSLWEEFLEKRRFSRTPKTS